MIRKNGDLRFTLTELLVIISFIGLVLALLIPPVEPRGPHGIELSKSNEALAEWVRLTDAFVEQQGCPANAEAIKEYVRVELRQDDSASEDYMNDGWGNPIDVQLIERADGSMEIRFIAPGPDGSIEGKNFERSTYCASKDRESNF